jgi:hypothetical protein
MTVPRVPTGDSPESSNKKTCFVISRIGKDASPERDQADQVFDYIIAPAAAECGYDPIRADHIYQPGIITRQIIKDLIEAPMVIADLTGHNPNVFYELAVRHVFRKPVVQIRSEGDSIPFDLITNRTLSYRYGDLRSCLQCRDDIVNHIRAAEADPSLCDSPISTTLDIEQLRNSDQPQDNAEAKILEAIADIQGEVALLKNAIAQIASAVEPRSLSMSAIPSWSTSFFPAGQESARAEARTWAENRARAEARNRENARVLEEALAREDARRQAEARALEEAIAREDAHARTAGRARANRASDRSANPPESTEPPSGI